MALAGGGREVRGCTSCSGGRSVPSAVGLAAGTVSAISELLIGFTATALTTPLLALTSCLNHHSNSSERCDLLFKMRSVALF